MTRPRLLPLLIVSLGISIAALEWLPAPYVWISLTWGTACLLAMRTTSRTGVRALWLNLAVIVFALGGLEVWARARSGGEARNDQGRLSQPVITPAEHYRRDDVLGYAPIPGIVIRAQRWFGETLLYDVKYSIGPDGLRVSPRASGGPPEACVLLFGDSFTFGDGLEDQQAMPYRVSEIGGGRFEVYNFGYRGYGPHQMLSALEHGRVASILKCRPTHVIYSAISDHVLRAAGRKEQSHHDPRYRLQPDGSVRFDGNFDDDQLLAELLPGARRRLARSAFYRWIMARDRGTSAAELQLFAGIVAQARRSLQLSHPGSVFETLLWDKTGRAKDVESALQTAGLAPRVVERILARSHENDAAYYIPYDGHPSAMANSLVAQFIVGSIIEESNPPPKVD